VTELLHILDFITPEPGRGGRCGCDGDYHVEFYHDEELLISVGYHHNKLLRWRNGPWRTDVELTNEARRAVPAWFADHEYVAMRDKYKAEGR